MGLDHVFLDAIGALRDAFAAAMLERQAFEERFQVDILLGDQSWETSYGLPGEGFPPRVRADVTLDWPTWSQTAYRNWYIGEPVEEPPEIIVEIVLRVQELRTTPEPRVVMAALPATGPAIGGEPLQPSGPSVEQLYDQDLDPNGAAIEVTYEGSYRLEEGSLEDGSSLDAHFSDLGGWIASTLVRLGDLKLDYRPPQEADGA